MRSLLALAMTAPLIAAAGTPAPAQTAAPAAPTAYPQTRTVAQVDDYFGTKVADPYRWLEDDNAAETKAWVEAQNKVTFGYLGKISGRAAIRKRLTKLWNYERYGLPRKRGGHYVFTRNDGLQNQAVYYRTTSLDADARGAARPEHAVGRRHRRARRHDVLATTASYWPTALSEGGSDWTAGRCATSPPARTCDDEVKWSKFSSAAWTHDGNGLLLQPLRRAEGGRGADRRQLEPEALLPQARHAAGRRRARLRAARPAGLGLRRRRHRRRQVPAHLPERRHRPEEPHLRQGPHPPRQQGRAVPQRLRRRRTTSSATTAPTFFFCTDQDAPRKRLVAIDTRPARAGGTGRR